MLLEKMMTEDDKLLIHAATRYGVKDLHKRMEGKVKRLGSGANATAFLLPSGNILRLEEEANEDGWHEWMERVVVKDTTDMTTRVGYFSMFNDPVCKTKRSIAIMERLYDIDCRRKAFARMDGVGYSIARVSTNDTPLERWDRAVHEHTNFERFFPKGNVEAFSRVVQDSNLSLNDCHMGNVMFRPHGEKIILTDPVN